MPATIIETNQTPFETVQVDPVDLDIIENSLRSARFEMDAVLFRTAMSPGIREQHDEFPLIANRDGKMVVGLGVLRVDLNCFPKVCFGFCIIPIAAQQQGESKMSLGVFGIDFDGSAKMSVCTR